MVHTNIIVISLTTLLDKTHHPQPIVPESAAIYNVKSKL